MSRPSTYEEVCTDFDDWLRERPGRFSVSGTTESGYFVRLVSGGEREVVGCSEFSTNDATANALAKHRKEST